MRSGSTFKLGTDTWFDSYKWPKPEKDGGPVSETLEKFLQEIQFLFLVPHRAIRYTQIRANEWGAALVHCIF